MRVLAVALILGALVPLAGAGHTPSCASVTVFPGPAFAQPQGLGARVWLDTNDADGIQTSDCTTSGGAHTAADFNHYQSVNCPIGPSLCVL